MIAINFQLVMALKLLVAFVLGACIGYDREKQNVAAGIRTYAAVCFGSTLFTAIAHELKDVSSASRIISNVIVGIGFLGAGTIFRSSSYDSARGLTTAATIWCTSAVGVAVGVDMFILAVVSVLLLYFLLSLERQKWYKTWKMRIRSPEENGQD